MKLIHNEIRAEGIVFRVETGSTVRVVTVSPVSLDVCNGYLIRGNSRKYIYYMQKDIQKAVDSLCRGVFPKGWRLAWGPDWTPFFSDEEAEVRKFLTDVKDKLE